MIASNERQKVSTSATHSFTHSLALAVRPDVSVPILEQSVEPSRAGFDLQASGSQYCSYFTCYRNSGRNRPKHSENATAKRFFILHRCVPLAY